MKLVTIYHPGLPDVSQDVPEVSLPHHMRAGWTTEPPDREPTEEPEAAADAGASSRPPRRRRQNEGE